MPATYDDLVNAMLILMHAGEHLPGEHDQSEHGNRDGDGSAANGKQSMSGSYSNLPKAERSKAEQKAINDSEYLTIKSEGEFEGYHWTTPDVAEKIEDSGLKGAPWDKHLGFTIRDESNLREDGAIFAFTDNELDKGTDWGEDAVLFKIKGKGYLVDHRQEGPQIIFRADQVSYERVKG